MYAVNFSTAGIQHVNNNNRETQECRKSLLVASYSSMNCPKTSKTSSLMVQGNGSSLRAKLLSMHKTNLSRDQSKQRSESEQGQILVQ